ARMISSHSHEFRLFGRFVLNNVTRHCCRGHSQWTGEVHLPRTAATGKVTVLCADDNLLRSRGDARSGIDAGAAAWLDDYRTGLFEDVQIAFAHAVLARLLRAELDVELH